MNPIISIVIPCYNQAQYLPETLQSVLNQEYQDWECIIVNDGSPDNTEEIALEWCGKDDRFRYFYKPNSGLSNTRNYGIEQSMGEYILPLDSDDIIDKEYISKAMECFNENSNTKLVYCNMVLFGDISKNRVLPKYEYQNMLTENRIFCSAVFKKSDFLKTTGYNPNMIDGLEDWDFWLSFLKPNDLVVKLDGFHFHYRIKRISMLRSISYSNNEKLLLQIFKNHLSLYLDYFNPIRDHINAEYYMERTAILKNSFEYRIGSIILFPLKIVKRVVNKIRK